MNNTHKLKVNDSHEFEVLPQDLRKLEVLQEDDSKLIILKDKIKYEVQFLDDAINGKRQIIKVNGNTFRVEISNPLDLLIDKMGFELGSSEKIGSIEAPMPGLILEVAVTGGQEVKEGDTLLILEAMKMENIITSPISGIIKNVEVVKGQAVDKKQSLLNFE